MNYLFLDTKIHIYIDANLFSTSSARTFPPKLNLMIERMSRPLRIEYEGAWYHVMNRGSDRKAIFIKDEHRLLFLELLSEFHK